MKEIFIISELSGQFGGSIRRAEQMILQTKMAGASACKVQLFDTYKLPGENREKWEYLSIPKGMFLLMKEFADRLNMPFFASPFDEERFEWCKEIDAPFIKIASSLLEWDIDLCKKIVAYGKPTLISLGKWDKEELPFGDEFRNVKYMHCVSKYPHTYVDALNTMPEKFPSPTIGYSDHSVGIGACKLAVENGAKIIEKHFTTDIGLQSETETAHACSMEYKDLDKLRAWCDVHTGSRARYASRSLSTASS